MRVAWPDGAIPIEVVGLLGDGDYSGPWHGIWLLRSPNGYVGTLDSLRHTVDEHEDGTITVSPSLVYTERDWHLDIPGYGTSTGWHGFLKHGEWSEA